MEEIEFITYFLKRVVSETLNLDVSIDLGFDDVKVTEDGDPIVIVDGGVEGRLLYGTDEVFNDVVGYVSIFTASKEQGWQLINTALDELYNYGFKIKTKGQKYINEQGRNLTQVELRNEMFNGKAYKKRLF